MAHDKQLGIGSHQGRTKSERIARLRERLAKVYSNPMDLVPVLKGILDLLEDEL